MRTSSCRRPAAPRKETPPRPRRPTSILDQSNLRFDAPQQSVPVIRAAASRARRSGDRPRQVVGDLGGAVSGARACVAGCAKGHEAGRTEADVPCTEPLSASTTASPTGQTDEQPEADVLPSQHPGSPAPAVAMAHGESAGAVHAFSGTPAASATARSARRKRRSEDMDGEGYQFGEIRVNRGLLRHRSRSEVRSVSLAERAAGVAHWSRPTRTKGSSPRRR